MTTGDCYSGIVPGSGRIARPEMGLSDQMSRRGVGGSDLENPAAAMACKATTSDAENKGEEVRELDDVTWLEGHLSQVGLLRRFPDFGDATFAELEAVAVGDRIWNSVDDAVGRGFGV